MSRRTTRATAGDAFSVSSIQPVAGNHIAPSTAMYMNNQYNHPAFNKLYLGPNLSSGKGSHGATSAVPKAPKAPEKPLMPYMRFSRKVWDDVKANQSDLKLWEIGKIIGKMWRELPAADKQLFVDEYDAEKLEYQDLLKSYHNSPAYQGYLQAKGRAEAVELAESRASERDDACMSIEAADDDVGDTDEGFSVKHVAAARYQRNHRLMQDITADCSVVPSGRGIVTEQRLDILQKQVQSLERHQSKLQTELHEIEKHHIETKHKWKDYSGKFNAEMKRLRNLTPQEYYIEYKKKQQALKSQAQKEAVDPVNNAAKEAESNSEQKDKTYLEDIPADKSTDSSAPDIEESDKAEVSEDCKQEIKITGITENKVGEEISMEVSTSDEISMLSAPEEDRDPPTVETCTSTDNKPLETNIPTSVANIEVKSDQPEITEDMETSPKFVNNESAPKSDDAIALDASQESTNPGKTA